MPADIGKLLPTIAEDNILCSGKLNAIEFPFKILYSNFFSGRPLSEHW